MDMHIEGTELVCGTVTILICFFVKACIEFTANLVAYSRSEIKMRPNSHHADLSLYDFSF